MRDDFSTKTKEIIAKRVNSLCSNPNCRKFTTGPSETKNKSINVGVAAHISAASKGGCRYDSSMSIEDRKSVKNGIWLCQTCSKLIDSDEIRYTTKLLQRWKDNAENFAQTAISSFNEVSGGLYNKQAIPEKLEEQMPKLFSEMRNDLQQFPFKREFIIMSNEGSRGFAEKIFAYYFEDHNELKGKIQILQNHSLIREITYKKTERFIISEELAEYLLT